MRLCEKCPLNSELESTQNSEVLSPTFQQVAQGLSDEFVSEVQDTLGLTEAKIEDIRQKEIQAWGESEERTFLRNNPELAKRVYECEHRITVLGKCALHSATKV